MYIDLITVGKLKERYWREACLEYEKRLSRYHKLKTITVADEKDPADQGAKAIAKVCQLEGQRIEQKIAPHSYVIALDVKGNRYDSEAFAQHLAQLESRGHTHLALIIGGSHGLSADILTRANERISFSDFTFPHQLMRVILLEQIYRASRINAGEPYHK
ncbi:23S rRNA (pseudouridine(1915)-N(3))-methyltransferase RlmH [Peptococcus simiae]|uniref:23S rRNA (pseudouridine(1915)-N(3))-methyltransferase RlmH n=1 Tax=Peptococcus simiae TaxID=1643805 RepID=UPI0039816DB8